MAPHVLYYDAMSQPCRAVILLCRMNGIELDLKMVNVGRNQTRSPEYLAINPLGKIPCLVDGDLRIMDSVAIMIYLCKAHNLPDHWYPGELKAQTLVNTVLAWHGSTLRTGSTITVFNRAIAAVKGVPSNEPLVQSFGLPTYLTALKTINDVWLAATPYVAGADISIADLLLVTEIDMARLLDAAPQGPTFEELLRPVPKVRAWRQRVEQRCAPYYDEGNALLLRARTRFISVLGGPSGTESKL